MDSRGFDPRVRQHSFVEIGHRIISTAIISLALIQVVSNTTVEKMCTMESKKVSNDQELIQSDPISCPENQKGNN